MRYQEIPPPPGLSRLIQCVWHLESDGPGAVQPVVPDGRVEIVIHLGEPFGELDSNGRVRRQHEVMVGGQLTRPIRLVPSSTARVIGIRLTTAGAGTVFPVHEMTNQLIPLNTIRRDLTDRLLDIFAAGNAGGDSLARVAEVVGAAANRGPSPLASGAVQMIETSDRPVRSLAADLGVTLRTLQRHFRNEVGVSPVLMRRIVRFRRVFRWLSRSPAMGIAGAAASAGYYDQSHLIRDFRQFAGSSPKRFFGGRADMAAALLGGDVG